MSEKSKKATVGSRRQLTEDFKKGAVQMLLDGHSATSIVNRLGLSEADLLYRWKRDRWKLYRWKRKLFRDSGPVASALDT